MWYLSEKDIKIISAFYKAKESLRFVARVQLKKWYASCTWVQVKYTVHCYNEQDELHKSKVWLDQAKVFKNSQEDSSFFLNLKSPKYKRTINQ